MARRLALLVASYDYQDAGLGRLEAPSHDAEALADVLRDPDVAGFDVTVLVNEPHCVVGEAIGDFYGNRRREDLTLLYFIGHGLKDDRGRLYLAMTNTKRERLSWTALPAELINDAMEACRSGQKMLVLDCCYSGAFPSGRATKADPAVHTLERFGGKGRVVLTASDATQYSFEGDDLTGEGSRSVFTRCFVEGLRTGKADLDGDGDISLDDLYRYVHDRVVEERPLPRPKKQENVEGRIIIARNIHWQLPSYLGNAIGGPISSDRLTALDGLHHLHRIGNDLVRTTVLDQVRRLTDDDDTAVSAAATSLLTELIPELARLVGHYDQGCVAVDSGRWDEAIEHFTAVTGTDPGYRDAAAKLEQARTERSLAGLRTELADLARAERWSDVLTVWDRVQKIQPDADDPGGVAAAARDEVRRQREAEREAERAEADRQRRVRQLQDELRARGEARNWPAVLAVSEQLAGLDPAAADPDGLATSARTQLDVRRGGGTRRARARRARATTGKPAAAERNGGGQAGRLGVQPPAPSQLHAMIEAVVKEVVTPGRILFNPPTEMRQGDRERVEVAIARSRDLDVQLRTNLRGRGVVQLEDLSTSPFMTVLLRGSAFDVTPLSPSYQLVAPVARWDFDVLPLHAGRHALQLCVSMRIGLPGRPDEPVAIPVFEHDIRVRVDPIYGTRQFVVRHWQWVLATLLGLGSAIGTWIELVHGKP